MKNFFASAALLTSLSQFLCIFCCVIPTATGILSILATLGLTGANTTLLGDLSFILHPYRGWILSVSVFLISLSWGLWFFKIYQDKKNALNNAISCACDSKKAKKPVFLMLATGLLIFNFVIVGLLH